MAEQVCSNRNLKTVSEVFNAGSRVAVNLTSLRGADCSARIGQFDRNSRRHFPFRRHFFTQVSVRGISPYRVAGAIMSGVSHAGVPGAKYAGQPEHWGCWAVSDPAADGHIAHLLGAPLGVPAFQSQIRLGTFGRSGVLH